MNAEDIIKALDEAWSGVSRVDGPCNACGADGKGAKVSYVGDKFDPTLCPHCGHIYVVHSDGRSRSLNAAEKQRIRDLNAVLGGRGRERQQKTVEQLWG